MADTAQNIRDQYPLPVYNYRVDFDGETIAFSKVSGLNIVYNTITYKESPLDGAGPKAFHMPGQGTPAELVLEKGLVRGQNIPKLYGWINQVKVNQVNKKNITISLCDEAGNPLVQWHVKNAFPVQLDAPTFDASANEVAVDTLVLMADTVDVDESSA